MPPGGRAKLDNPGVAEIFTRFYCNYCQEEINGLRVSCAYCDDFDLCPECFACGAEIGGHKNHHKYYFSNNGNFSIFPKSPTVTVEDKGRRRASLQVEAEREVASKVVEWNVREDTRLLDAVEMFGFGNWKDIAKHVETKSDVQVKERYIKCYINGVVGKFTWTEDSRGLAVDHTQDADRGPLSPTLTSKLPPINVAPNEALLLGYMPNRDDFEDFDRSNEAHVSQHGVRSFEDEDIDIAMKLAHTDIYERALREEVRRKRVARDYQLVSQYFAENPLIQFGVKITPHKMANLLKLKRHGAGGPKQELMDALKPYAQFNTCQEFKSLVDNLCFEKELKVRIKELMKYRDNGLMKANHLVGFERERFKREARIRAKSKSATVQKARLLPRNQDYSVRALLSPESGSVSTRGVRGAVPGEKRSKKKNRKKWSTLKKKTGKRLLLSMGCTLTAPDTPDMAEMSEATTDGMKEEEEEEE